MSQQNTAPTEELTQRVRFRDAFIAYLWDIGAFCFTVSMINAVLFIPIGLLRGAVGINTPHTVLSSILAILLGFSLFLLRDGFHDHSGTGFGKSFRSILVVDAHSFAPCGYARSLLRNILYLISVCIPIVILVDFFRLISSHQARTISDILSRTRVVYNSK